MRNRRILLLLLLLIGVSLLLTRLPNRDGGGFTVQDPPGAQEVSTQAAEGSEAAEQTAAGHLPGRPHFSGESGRDGSAEERLVFGRVVNEAGEDQKHALVFLAGLDFHAQVRTDDRGRFRFENPPLGGLSLIAQKDGYLSFANRAHLTRVVLEEATPTVGPVTLTLKPAARIQLEIVSAASGLPIPGAMAQEDLTEEVFQADEEGRIELTLSREIWSLSLWAEGYAKRSKSLSAMGISPRLIRVELEAGGELSGTVRDDAGMPLAGVRLFLSFRPLSQNSRTFTDAEGHFRFSNLLLGRPFNLFVQHFGHEPFYFKEQILDEPIRRLDIELKPYPEKYYRISGTVVDLEGRPIPGVRLGFFRNSSQERRTDGRGRYLFERIVLTKSGDNLIATAEGFAGNSMQVKPHETEQTIDFVLEAGNWLAGRVVDEEGRALAHVDVRALNGAGETVIGPREKTDARGVFRRENLPKNPRFIFSKEDYAMKTWDPKILNRDDVEIVLERGLSLEGQVIDGLSGEPVRRFRLRLSERYGFSRYGARYFEPIEFEDPLGYFFLPGLNNKNPVTLTIDSPDFTANTFRHVIPDYDQKREVFALYNKRLTIAGTAVDSEGRPMAGIPVSLVLYPANSGLSYPDQAEETRILTTDGRGAFRFEEVPEQDLSLVVVAPGYSHLVLGELERLSEQKREDLRLVITREAVLEGLVNLEVFPQATHVAMTLGQRGTGLSGEVETQHGRFRMEGISPGEQMVRLEGYNRVTGTLATKRVLFSEGEVSTVRFGFEDAYRVMGLVRIGGLTPEGGSLFLRHVEDSTIRPLTCEIEPGGRFVFERVPIGDYHLGYLRKGGYGPSRQSPAYEHAVAVVDEDVQGSWDFPAFGRLHGRIDHRVKVQTLQLRGENGSFRAVRSDARGHFEFEEIPPGHYTLSVMTVGQGIRQLLPDVWMPDDGSDLDLGLVPYMDRGRLSLHVQGWELLQRGGHVLRLEVFAGDDPVESAQPLLQTTYQHEETTHQFENLPEGQVRLKLAQYTPQWLLEPHDVEIELGEDWTAEWTVNLKPVTLLQINVDAGQIKGLSMTHGETGARRVFSKGEYSPFQPPLGAHFWGTGACARAVAAGTWQVIIDLKNGTRKTMEVTLHPGHPVALDL